MTRKSSMLRIPFFPPFIFIFGYFNVDHVLWFDEFATSLLIYRAKEAKSF